jgi:hypothetical protein
MLTVDHEGAIYAATRGNTNNTSRRGLYISTDNGVSFIRDNTIDEPLMDVLVDQNRTIHVGRQSWGYAFKAQEDVSWTLVDDGVVIPEASTFRARSFYKHSNGDLLISGHNGLVITRDNGVSFETIFNLSGSMPGFFDYSTITPHGNHLVLVMGGSLYIAQDYFENK